MSLHISPTTGCNLGCTYCYENPEREANEEWVDSEYDINAIMDRLEDWKERYPGQTPGLHGGEPLLMRTEDMERIFKWVNDNYGKDKGSHIQTNATMMTEKHIELFKKYNVHVGVSCDGPGELNQHRVAHEGGDDVTKKHTEKTIRNIHRLCENDVNVGLIVVLHEANAGTDERLERLLDWIQEMGEKGVTGHYNPAIPYEDVQTDISLDPERLKEVYLRTWEWLKESPDRTWNPMRTYVDNLLGIKLHNCVNDTCDVYNAGAAKIVTGDGETTGCGKTWSGVGDGSVFLQGPSTGNEYNNSDERYSVLKQTPGPYTDDENAPDMGGCKGCKYWNVCTGGCPSAGMNDDHRNRTVWCEAKYALYERIEQELRGVLPNIRLITDFPWDVGLNDVSSERALHIRPFEAMQPNDDPEGMQNTSTFRKHAPKSKRHQLLPNGFLDTLSKEQLVTLYEADYGEGNVWFENGVVMADSNRDSVGSTDRMGELDASWEEKGEKGDS